ncbi:MAG TPA: iron-containing alcohol dehydrogenase [Verrucomicrobia bacterium]|nr:iron-containing alcohol dehydrogenase [Verrucomicrobiota bacterium]HOP97578.1 iron-containing alcohol dehydrogenase [Verrucomicrobiota bacterium]
MRFEFATASRILFGPGSLRDLGGLVRDLGRRALVVTGRQPARAEPLLNELRRNAIECAVFSFGGEPQVSTVIAGIDRARKEHCSLVIGFGGGSAIDAAKAIAGMLANEGELLDYLEIIGRGKALAKPSAPFIAIPTTSGSGAEVTRNAVLASPEHQVKVSLRSPFLLARAAVIDPELTLSLSPSVTAATGLDALTQLIEPYVCTRANPVTDALCVEALPRVARSLRTACSNGNDIAAREDMCVASLFGGLALANAGLGAVHGFAAPIGGAFTAPHGAVCAALLPHVMRMNVRALRAQTPDAVALNRYRTIARLLTGNPAAEPDDAVNWVQDLVRDLNIPPLGSYGIKTSDIPGLVQKASRASSMKPNPVKLTDQQLTDILTAAL